MSARMSFERSKAPMSPDSPGGTRRLVLGVLASIALVVVWGLWPALTRQGSQQLDWRILVFMRFAVPAILLLWPVTRRIGLVPRGVPVATIAIMAVMGSFG